MNVNIPSELLTLVAGINYTPTKRRSDDKRRSNGTGDNTSIGGYNIGADAQQGYALGPIFRINFVDLTAVVTATHIKIWGIKHIDNTAPEYPLAWFTANPTLDVYLQKFEFTDGAGAVIDESGNKTIIIGHKLSFIPFNIL